MKPREIPLPEKSKLDQSSMPSILKPVLKTKATPSRLGSKRGSVVYSGAVDLTKYKKTAAINLDKDTIQQSVY